MPEGRRFVTRRRYRERMDNHVIELTDAELALLTAALRSYLSDFGHDEADLQHAIKQLLAKLPHPTRAG
jgi:UDP-N-acetylglucosamine transferase subunit ALG13